MVWLLLAEGYIFNFDIYFVWFIRLQAQSPVPPPVQLQNQPQIRPKCWPQVRPQVRPPIWPQVSPPIWPQVETEARPQTWRLTMRVHSSLNIHLVEREVNFITNTAQKMKFSIEDFFSKYDQIRSFLQIWLHLLKKSFMENFIFCAVQYNFIGKWNVFALRNSNQSSSSCSATERNDLCKSMIKKFHWMCWMSRGNIAYFFSELTKIGKLIAVL